MLKLRDWLKKKDYVVNVKWKWLTALRLFPFLKRGLLDRDGHAELAKKSVNGSFFYQILLSFNIDWIL